MKCIKKLLFISITLLSQGFWLFTFSQADNLRHEIDKIIRFDTDIDIKNKPGFIIAVIDNDSTYFLSFGSKVINKKVEFSKDDIFEIGSVTKIFTAGLISLLMEEGTISKSALVNDYLPAPYRNPRLTELTIFDLVHHHSGFSKLPKYFGRKEKELQNPYAHYFNKDLLAYYRDFIPEEKTFVYSHTNYALLENILTNVTKLSYEDALVQKILEPLQMNSTFTDFPETRDGFVVKGYDKSLRPVQPWTFNSFKGSEGIKSSASDLSKFIKASMNLSHTKLDSIFANNFVNQPIKSFNDQLSVSMGWHNVVKNSFNIYMHTGRTSGSSAFVGMVRETGTAVIILSNSSIGTEDLGMQVLRMINYNWKRINS
jgi:CubicO group peptidase (beta-lactamase class C family)